MRRGGTSEAPMSKRIPITFDNANAKDLDELCALWGESKSVMINRIFRKYVMAMKAGNGKAQAATPASPVSGNSKPLAPAVAAPLTNNAPA